MMTSLNSLISGHQNTESDWGIEEPPLHRKRFDSVSTSDYSQPPRIRDTYAYKSPTLINHSGSFSQASSHDGFFGSRKENDAWSPVQASTENVSKYIGKYLCLQTNTGHFIEKFKYNLIISNLLDDSLVQSKNEQALSNLLQMKSTEDNLRGVPPKRRPLPSCPEVEDGSYLQIMGKRYHLHVPGLGSPGNLLSILFLILFLLKQNIKLSSSLRRTSKVEMFKRLLLYSTKYIKYKRINYSIESFRSLRNLNDFMISNCKMNKVIISSFIFLREHDLFHAISKPPSGVSPAAAKTHLNSLLDGLMVNIKTSIRDSLIYTNGDLLEKYCEINNIPMGLISDHLDVEAHGNDEHESESLSIKYLTAKLNVFNNFRRFFICQLLTVHEGYSPNYLLLKLGHNFNINFACGKNHSTMASKLRALNSIFDAHVAMLNQFLALNEKFHSLYNPDQIDLANDNILCQPVDQFSSHSQANLFPSKRDMNLDNLVDKLQNLTSNLKYYKTYFGQNLGASPPSISDPLSDPSTGPEDYEEKLAIFASFSAELKSSMELYSSCLTDYKAEGNRSRLSIESARSSQTNSKPTSVADSYGLKSFHTTPSASKKKNVSEEELKKYAERRKRYSSGLSGLLTVLEDSKGDARDDEDLHESYNSAALEALTKRVNAGGSNRFSMISANSNLSGITDLIASTQFTTDEEEMDKAVLPPMNQDELRRKLEESFKKIYSLETENEKLLKSTSSNSTCEPRGENGQEISSIAAKDGAFLGSLEKTLSTNAGSV